MKSERLLSSLVTALGIMAVGGAVRAETLTGTLNIANGPNGFTGDSGASSLTLSGTNRVLNAGGDFSGNVPINSIVFAPDGELTGLSTTPQAHSINNFLWISGADFYSGFIAPATAPENRFFFDLATIAEDSYTFGTGAAVYSGTGTIVDSTGAFSSSAADFTINFSDFWNYTISIGTVPEPGTVSLLAAGLLGLVVLRRRPSGFGVSRAARAATRGR